MFGCWQGCRSRGCVGKEATLCRLLSRGGLEPTSSCFQQFLNLSLGTRLSFSFFNCCLPGGPWDAEEALLQTLLVNIWIQYTLWMFVINVTGSSSCRISPKLLLLLHTCVGKGNESQEEGGMFLLCLRSGILLRERRSHSWVTSLSRPLPVMKKGNKFPPLLQNSHIFIYGIFFMLIMHSIAALQCH